MPGLACAATVGVVAALTACGGGDADDASAPPAVSITLSSSDDRPAHRDAAPSVGQRTTLRGRATRDGAPIRGERVQLMADRYPFGDGERVAASATTGRDGRFVLRARFDRNTEVRARLADDRAAASSPVSIQRTARLSGGDIEELSDGRNRFTGFIGYPPDVEARFRFAMYVGLSSDRRLARRPARMRVTKVRPGRLRITTSFRAPTGWRMQMCVIPHEETGLSRPRVGCRGPWARNTDRKIDREEREEEERRREQERLREQDAGAGSR